MSKAKKRRKESGSETDERQLRSGSAVRNVIDLLDIVLNSRALVTLVVGYSCPNILTVIGSLWSHR